MKGIINMWEIITESLEEVAWLTYLDKNLIFDDVEEPENLKVLPPKIRLWICEEHVRIYNFREDGSPKCRETTEII